MENTKKYLKMFVEPMLLTFAIMSLFFILSEFFSGEGESDIYHRGQRFELEGMGLLYVEGRNCVVILQDMEKMENIAVIPQGDRLSGNFHTTVSINGKLSGRLTEAPLTGCKIRTSGGLKSEFKSGLLGSELISILIANFIFTSMGTGVIILLAPQISEFSH